MERATIFCAQIQLLTEASKRNRHLLPCSPAELAPAGVRFAAFSPGLQPLPAFRASSMPAHPGSRYAAQLSRSRSPCAAPALSTASATAVTFLGRGLAPQLRADWLGRRARRSAIGPRDCFTWPGADKRPLPHCTRASPQPPPSGDSGEGVPALTVRRRRSA